MTALSAALPLSVPQLRLYVRETLKAAGIENYRQEADWLLEHGLQLSASALLAGTDTVVTPGQAERVRTLVNRRAAREPLQYILGTQEFQGWDIQVNPAVLIPRPETELLVEEALTSVAGQSDPVLADVGTGSGCIAIAIAKARADAKVYAVDIAQPALAVAKANTVRHAVLSQVRLIAGNLLQAFARRRGGIFHAIVSNPPYISDAQMDSLQPEVGRYEPRLALAAGPDGLDYYRRLIADGPGLLKPAGHMILELGAGLADEVQQLVACSRELVVVHCRPDEAGVARVLVLRKI